MLGCASTDRFHDLQRVVRTFLACNVTLLLDVELFREISMS
jgi:hypothetical protein